MVYSKNSLEVLLVTASTALMFIWVAAPRAEAGARTRSFVGRYLLFNACLPGHDDVHRSFLRLSRDSTKLAQCLRSFRSCHVLRERPALNSTAEVEPADADGDRSGGKRISFVTFDSELSLSSISLRTRCLTNAVTTAIKPWFWSILPTSPSIKTSEHHHSSKFLSSVSFRTSCWIIFVITSSTNEKEESVISSLAS